MNRVACSTPAAIAFTKLHFLILTSCDIYVLVRYRHHSLIQTWNRMLSWSTNTLRFWSGWRWNHKLAGTLTTTPLQSNPSHALRGCHWPSVPNQPRVSRVLTGWAQRLKQRLLVRHKVATTASAWLESEVGFTPYNSRQPTVRSERRYTGNARTDPLQPA